MKKSCLLYIIKVLLMSCLLFLSTGMANAQTFLSEEDGLAGALHVKKVELTGHGDSLSLEMELLVEKEAVSKRQSWAIVPQLVAYEGDGFRQATFPYALVNGQIREKLYKRMLKFSNAKLLANLPHIKEDISKRGDDVVLHYTVQVLYEPWMDAAGLRLNIVLLSPAGKSQMLVVENAGRVKFTHRTPYEVQLRANFTQPESENKHRNMRGQNYLDFHVGSSNISSTFHSNPQELAKISSTVAEVMENPDAHITGLFIEGYSSPEGSYSTNERLASARSKALRDYLIDQYGFDVDLFRVCLVPEDWDGLRTLVERSSLTETQKQEVLAVIDGSDSFDKKEASLRARKTIWQVMNREMFPQLRRVEYQINFSVRNYTPEESRALVERNPGMLSHQELFLLAMSYSEGSKEREETFELIARLYPNDIIATINVAGVMLERGEYDEAKRLLERVGNDSRAFNNLGVLYLKTGEPDKAKDYLEKAAELGVEEAIHNLGELQRKAEDDRQMRRYAESGTTITK